MSKVIREYMNKIYSLVIILVTGSVACAAVTFAALKMLGFYPDVSWIALGVFLGTCTAYLTIGIILIRISYEKDSDGNKNLKPKMLKVGKIFVLVLLAIQYNFIYYMIPTREFWACVFYFAILAAFFLDIKVVVISIVESFASLVVVSIVKSDVVLPIKDSIFIAELALRIVTVMLCLFAVFLMCLLINRYLVDMKKDEIESNNARVQKVLSTAQALSEKLLKAGTVLSKISSNETTTAQELASTGEALLADSNALRKKSDASIANLNELKDCGKLLSNNVEQVAQTSGEIIDKSSENEKSLNSLQAVNKEVIQSMIETSAVAEKLSEAVKGIDVTLKLISDIAMSTNILSLNATIEAARAGEAGKGFAVVAHEVGNLANGTQQSLSEIQTVMSRVQDNVIEMTSYVDNNNKKLNLQNEYFASVFNNMNEINTLLHQSMDDINAMNNVHSRQNDVIKRTVDINVDIAESIEKENREFALITSMVENNAKDAVQMKNQVKSINEMAEQIDVLLK